MLKLCGIETRSNHVTIIAISIESMTPTGTSSRELSVEICLSIARYVYAVCAIQKLEKLDN